MEHAPPRQSLLHIFPLKVLAQSVALGQDEICGGEAMREEVPAGPQAPAAVCC